MVFDPKRQRRAHQKNADAESHPIVQKGGRRTFSELQNALKQWQAAQGGTKPVETIKSGFISGGRVKGKLSGEQKGRRAEIRTQIKAIKQSMRKDNKDMPQTDVQRMRHQATNKPNFNNKPHLPPNTNPGTGPQPKPSGQIKPKPNQTPPTKPPQRGTVAPSFKPTGVTPPKERALRKRYSRLSK